MSVTASVCRESIVRATTTAVHIPVVAAIFVLMCILSNHLPTNLSKRIEEYVLLGRDGTKTILSLLFPAHI